MLDKASESLKQTLWLDEPLSHEGGLQDNPHTPTNSLTWRFCMRCSSWRCSAVVNL